jgi:hypothetical protein
MSVLLLLVGGEAAQVRHPPCLRGDIRGACTMEDDVQIVIHVTTVDLKLHCVLHTVSSTMKE